MVGLRQDLSEIGSEEEYSMTRTSKRLTSQARKQQIVELTLRLVAQYGVPGTSMSRVAAAAGVSKAALYGHFKNRREILLAALDAVFDRAFEAINSSTHPDVRERLGQICEYESALVSADDEGFVYPLFEFVAAPPSEGLRDALVAKQLATVRALALIVEEGKQQGTILGDVDSEQTAWEIVGLAWTQDVASMMGVREFWNNARSARIRDLIIKSISTQAPYAARSVSTANHEA